MGSILLIIKLLSLGLAFGSPLLKSEEAKNHEGGLNIINGNFTTIDKYPIDVAFLIANNIWGAGVIVDKNWILTTAFNCLWVDPSFITIRVGSSNWTEDGDVIPAQECVMHPEYTGNWANNIALVKLTEGVSFGKLSRQGYYNVNKTLNVPNATYYISGWGVRSPSFQKETQLQTIKQTILADDECSKFYNLTAATGSFCASNLEGGPCAFDFGAPMNKRRFVAGLYQGSIDCTKPEIYPALYVDVFPYIDWITSVIGQ